MLFRNAPLLSRVRTVTALFLVLLCAPLAQAEFTVDAKLTSISSGGIRFYYSKDGVNGSALAVEQYYTKTTHTSSNPDAAFITTTFSTFCVEITEHVSVGGTYHFNVKDVKDVPNPGPPSPMGDDKANMIRELWGRHYSEVDTAAERAAFQIAIWNIVYDGDKSIKTSGGGGFKAQNYDNTVGGYMRIAQDWLESLTGDTSKYERNLVGLSQLGAQDQITVATPAPPSWLLSLGGAAGLLGFAAFRRRRILPC